ncbi:hypothetical protein B0H12DRAFT_199781 [Mycena haematopus]|nr:hypothetical protein B0H12DRAFT_199781 [Mycena haematopus]
MSAPLRRRLAELDAQIVEQRRMLQDLQKIRFDVERDLHATATFPVLTLPTEITAEIFLCCLPLFDSLSVPNLNRSAAVVLAGVCRSWRNIAQATPALWSELEVQFGEIATRVASKPGLVEGHIDLLLSRAHNRPLSLRFRLSRDGAFALSRLRDIIHRWSHRVGYIYLYWGYFLFDMGALGLDSAVFPLLQGAMFDSYDLCPSSTHTILFGNAPCFHDLCMPSCTFTPRKVTLPWLQLTKFEGLLDDLELFTVAPNLTEMTCLFVPPDDEGFITVIHHNLRSLTIIEDGHDVIQYLTLPALTHLDVSKMDSHDTLESFLARSSPPLVSLSVHTHDQTIDLDHLDKSMPLVASTLENLELSGACSDEMFPVFSLLDRDSPPNIRTLTFKCIYGTLNLNALVHSLYAHSTQLRAFRLVWATSPFLDATCVVGPSRTFDTIGGHLSRLAQTGMDIYLGTPSKNYALISDTAIGQNLL